MNGNRGIFFLVVFLLFFMGFLSVWFVNRSREAAQREAATATSEAVAALQATRQAQDAAQATAVAATAAAQQQTAVSLAATSVAQAATATAVSQSAATTAVSLAATQTVEAVLGLVAQAATATAAAAPAGAADEPVVVQLAYSAEKADWLAPLIAQYNAAQRRLPNGRPITVEATIANPIELATDLIEQRVQTSVWFPTASFELDRVAAAWQQRTGGELSAEVVTSVVESPLVIGMWEPMAQELGWGTKPVGWQQIAELVGRDWATTGEAAWGRFKLGHTNPAFNASGLGAVLSAAYGASGKSAGLTAADLAAPAVRTRVERLQTSVVNYGDETRSYAKRVLDCATGGPTFISAVVLYESDIVSQPTCKDRAPMVAIYPSDGTFVVDHPYAILQAPWVTDDQRAGARDLLAFLLDTDAQQAAIAAGFRPNDPALLVGSSIDLAEPKNLLAPPDGTLTAAAVDLWQQTKRGADVVLVFDRSGSMENDGKIIAARQGMIEFVNLLSDRDRVQLIVFSGSQEVVSPLSELGAKRSRLIEQIQAIRPEGPTTIYDSLLLAYKDLQEKGDPKRLRSVVIMTDGRDERQLESGQVVPASTATLEDVIATASGVAEPDTGVRLFTIAYGSDADNTALRQITGSSNGISFRGNPETIQQIYRRIALFL